MKGLDINYSINATSGGLSVLSVIPAWDGFSNWQDLYDGDRLQPIVSS